MSGTRVLAKVTGKVDVRGFGFVRPESAKTDVFYHISESESGSLYDVGDAVSCVLVEGREGKPRAESVRAVGNVQPAEAEQTPRGYLAGQANDRV